MKNIQAAEPLRFVLSQVKSASMRVRGPISDRGMEAVLEREQDFSTSLEMKLTGLGVDPDTRRYADQLLDEYWAEHRYTLLRRVRGNDQRTRREVIIGSGYHAAVYASVRVAAGFPKPLVIDQAPRAGGVFAMTQRPIFYLNSSNRPGGPGFVFDLEAQPNYLPGAPVQPANISAAQFETNADMAWVIRMALAQNAEVITNFKVSRYRKDSYYSEKPRLISSDDDSIVAARVIDARGLGLPSDLAAANGRTVLTFPDFMQRMDSPWPLRNIRRVAVIGGGDAGRVSVEQLVGIGPQANLSMALDQVELVDWYGKGLPQTPSEWRDQSLTRYLPISKFLRDGKIGTRRVRVFDRRATATALPDQALVGGRSYDLVVLATGWEELRSPQGLLSAADMGPYTVGDLEVGRWFPEADDEGLFRIGPHARIPFNNSESRDGLDKKSNAISMSRLGPRTAALAASLPQPDVVGNSYDRLAA